MDANYKLIWGQMNNTTTKAEVVSANVLKLKLKNNCCRWVGITPEVRQTALQRPANATGMKIRGILLGWISAKMIPAVIKQGATLGNTCPNAAVRTSISSTAITSIMITRSTKVANGLVRTTVNITSITDHKMSRNWVALTLTHAGHVALPPMIVKRRATQKPLTSFHS